MFFKKQFNNLNIKVFTVVFLLFNITGCSFIYSDKYSSKEKYNEISREIIKNFSIAISKDPNNYFFYLERGKAKHDYIHLWRA